MRLRHVYALLFAGLLMAAPSTVLANTGVTGRGMTAHSSLEGAPVVRTIRAAKAPISDADKYAERETRNSKVAEFEGGASVIIIGGSTLAVVAIVVLLIILL